MKVRLNGTETDVGSRSTITDLVASLGLGQRRLAVELNRKVIRREDWPTTKLAPSDTVEIVQFVGGG